MRTAKAWPDSRRWLSRALRLRAIPRALVAGYLATEVLCSAYVSIGGGWAEDPFAPSSWPIARLPVPSMFVYGTNDEFAVPTTWDVMPPPTHKVIFDRGEHWNYLDATAPVCGKPERSLPVVEQSAADLTAVFLSKQMRVAGIPDTLRRAAVLSQRRAAFYAGAHLTSFGMLPQAGCSVEIKWNTPVAGSTTLPWL